MEFKSFCRGFLRVREFDQLISEKENSQGVPSWMHIGYKNSEGVLGKRRFLPPYFVGLQQIN